MSGGQVIVKARHTGLDESRMSAANLGPKDEKAARLAAQLRANLKRRKEQARGADAGAMTKPDDGATERD